MTKTRSGARLSSKQHGFRFRLAQMSSADYAQPKCVSCGAPISDDRLYTQADEKVIVCSRRCWDALDRRRHGVPIGRATTMRGVYEAARAAHGAWVEHSCVSELRARRTAHSINQRRDFEASYNGTTVRVRLVAA